MKKITFSLALGVIALSFALGKAHAATFIVTTTDDPAPNGCNSNIDCSLREAVIAANLSGGEDTITLPPGNYLLTRNGNDDLSNTGDLDVLDFLIVNGVSAANTSIDASALGDRIFDIASGPSALTLNNLTLKNGNVLSSPVPSGGAVYVTGGNLIVNNCLFTENTAESGGAIYSPGARSVTVSNSAFTKNEATGSQPVMGGGAIYLGINNELFLSNSTLSQNTSGGFGGGINATGADLVIRSSTISENVADDEGGGVFLNDSSSTLNIANSILATNQVGSGSIDCSLNAVATVTSGGYNIFGGVSDCGITMGPDDQDGVADTGLLTIANYGGQTPSYLPELTSVAIDNGDPTGCDDALGNPLATDQRGQNREAGGRCDSGADELGISDLLVTKTQDASAISSGGTLIYTVTVTNSGPDNNFNVAVTDTLPSEVSFASVTTNDPTDICSQNSGTVSCGVGQLDSGASAVITIAVVVDSIPLGGTITNTASATGTETDPNPDNGTASIDTTVNAEGGCSLGGQTPANSMLGLLGFALMLAVAMRAIRSA